MLPSALVGEALFSHHLTPIIRNCLGIPSFCNRSLTEEWEERVMVG
jgi:hypothetical protein